MERLCVQFPAEVVNPLQFLTLTIRFLFYNKLQVTSETRSYTGKSVNREEKINTVSPFTYISLIIYYYLNKI